MASYPWYPQYGGVYNAQDHTTQRDGVLDPTVTRHPYGFANDLPYMNGNTAREAATVLPHVNTSSFQVNGSRSISPRDEVMQNNSIVSGGRPSLNAPPLSSTQILPHSNSQLQAGSTPVQAASSATVNLIKTTDAAESDIEDGEVDDEGIDKPSNAIKEAEMGAMFSSHTPHNPTEHESLTPAADEKVVVSSDSRPISERDQGNFAHNHASCWPP